MAGRAYEADTIVVADGRAGLVASAAALPDGGPSSGARAASSISSDTA